MCFYFPPKCEENIFSKIHYKNSVICDHIEEVRWYLWGAYNRTEPKHLVYLMTHKNIIVESDGPGISPSQVMMLFVRCYLSRKQGDWLTARGPRQQIKATCCQGHPCSAWTVSSDNKARARSGTVQEATQWKHSWHVNP